MLKPSSDAEERHAHGPNSYHKAVKNEAERRSIIRGGPSVGDLVHGNAHRLFLVPSAGEPDPFATFAVPFDGQTATHVEYFQMMWNRISFQAAQPTQRHVIRDTSVNDIVQSCMQSELTHDAFTAGVVMRMITIHAVSASKVHAEYSASRAMRRLRKHIEAGRTLSTQHFLPVLFLAAYEFYAQNLSGCRAHLTLLHTLGVQQVLDGYLMTFCHNLDIFCASSALCSPIFPIETPSSNITPGNNEKVNLSIETFARHCHLLGPSLTNTTIPLILDCASAADLCRQTFLNPTSRPSAQDELYQVVMHRCNSLKALLLRHLPASSPEQEACIVALLIWLSYLPLGALASAATTGHVRATEDFRRLIPSRGRALLVRLQQWGSTDRELQLWVAAVGMVFSPEKEVVEACAALVAVLAEALGVGDEGMAAHLEKYLWLSGFDLIRRVESKFRPLAA